VALAVILIATKLFCKFCIATYAVNIGILAVAVLWFLGARKDERFSLPGALREIVSAKDASPDKKAFQSAFVLFLFLLCFALFSTSYILTLKTGNRRVPTDKINAFLTSFYQQPAQKIDFPDTGIILGNPDAEVTLYVFTDFLCSACYEFYKMEQYLFSKYGGRVRTVYYNFPLDQGCNNDLKRTVYKNSCIAARAFSAASDAGFTDEYTIKHFADYEKTHTRYDMNLALAAFRLMSPANRRGVDEARFLQMMNSRETSSRIEDHIRLGRSWGVDSPPIISIGGRRLVGSPPLQVMDQMIGNELERK
jgi:protein-disulfide isomerase